MAKKNKMRKKKLGRLENSLPGIELLEKKSVKKGVVVFLGFLGVFYMGMRLERFNYKSKLDNLIVHPNKKAWVGDLEYKFDPNSSSDNEPNKLTIYRRLD